MIAPSRKKKICDVLKSVFFNDADDVVEVSDGDADDLHLRVISRKFRGLGLLEKNDVVWNVLLEKLEPEEWGEISMTVAMSPDERDPVDGLR
jgi:hypothetical protein